MSLQVTINVMILLDSAFRCVSTMVLLASVPALNVIGHDPVIWMDKIMQISKKSGNRYQLYIDESMCM